MLKWARCAECWVSDSCCVPAGRGWPPLVCVGSPVGLFPLSPGGTARPGSGPSHRPPAVCADRPPPPPAASCCAPAARGFGSGSSRRQLLLQLSFTSSSREQRDASRSYWDCSSSTCTRGRWPQEEIKRLCQVCLL